ncbi:MAG TPA: EF-hand domain-containing protein [Steroidobacteraceae bacterium]
MVKTIAAFALLATLSAPALAGPTHDRLEQADANKDGMITRDELDMHRAERFAKLDKNADGYLDASDRQGRRRRGRHGSHFESLDTDGDGKISKDEFMKAPTPLFDKFDADKSGVLDAQEIEAAKAAAKERAGERRRR